MPNRSFDDHEDDHADALSRTGFWGKRAAGCILFCAGSRRFGFPLRSPDVLEPNTYGTVGGAIDGKENSKQAVLRELNEELGYHGPAELVPLDVFQSGTFSYETFLAIVQAEFRAKLNWESSDFVWVRFGQWPQPLHPGLATTLGKPDVIRKMKQMMAVREMVEPEPNEVLYHGTNAEFDQFDMKMARNSKHIFTTPDLDTAKNYGRFVYEVVGNQKPSFYIDPEYDLDDIKVFKRLYADMGRKKGTDMNFDEFLEVVTSGEMWNRDMKPYFQNDILDLLFSYGYRSIRMFDQAFGGHYATSVIFNNPADVRPLKRVV